MTSPVGAYASAFFLSSQAKEYVPFPPETPDNCQVAEEVNGILVGEREHVPVMTGLGGEITVILFEAIVAHPPFSASTL